MQEQVAQLLPTREGHFVFESGHHGQVWLDLQLLLLHPERVQPWRKRLRTASADITLRQCVDPSSRVHSWV